MTLSDSESEGGVRFRGLPLRSTGEDDVDDVIEQATGTGRGVSICVINEALLMIGQYDFSYCRDADWTNLLCNCETPPNETAR